MKKIKIKLPKNKKVIYALFALAAVLLLGLTLNMINNIVPQEDTCEVVIRYNKLDSDGVSTTFDTFRKEYPKGERINIASPDEKCYVPDREKVSIVVKSDIVITITYEFKGHTADEALDTVIKYPTSEEVGILERHCAKCKEVYREDFTTLTRTVVFGGEVLKAFENVSQVVEGYDFETETNKILILNKDFVPELDIIFDGIEGFDGKSGLGEAATVTFDYDKEIWNGAEVVYKADPALPTVENADFSFRFGNGWRIVFGFEGRFEGVLSEFIIDDNCPLIHSPLTITLTYDYTK